MSSNYWDTVSERPRNTRQRQELLHQQQRGSKESLIEGSDEEGRPSLMRTTTTTTTTVTVQATESRWTVKEKELFIEAYIRNGKVSVLHTVCN